MIWKYYPLAESDPKGRNHLLKGLSVSARDHTLSRKLESRVSDATGPIILVAFESLDLERITDYEFAAYYGGKGLRETTRSQNISQIESPLGGLALFLENHLRSSKEAVVLCENLYDSRTPYLTNWRPRESRVVFFREEIYHVLTSLAANFESIETAVRESMDRLSMGMCSFCDSLPEGDIPSESFFDVIVANTAHIFAEALDGEGFLIWSPRSK